VPVEAVAVQYQVGEGLAVEGRLVGDAGGGGAMYVLVIEGEQFTAPRDPAATLLDADAQTTDRPDGIGELAGVQLTLTQRSRSLARPEQVSADSKSGCPPFSLTFSLSRQRSRPARSQTSPPSGTLAGS
jgi:hypothetical protein